MLWWTPQQVRTFLGAVDGDRFYALWVLLLTTGMRRGELAGLRWCDVDLDAGVLSVVRTRVSVAYTVSESDPKTRSSRRSVTLDARVVAVLRTHRRRQLEERLRWGEAWTDTGYVFTREDGWPIHPERISVLFARLVEIAGVPKIRLHDLRHTSASLALASGVHPKVVGERLGHSSISVTLDLSATSSPACRPKLPRSSGT
jgi:integrase